MSNRPRFQFLLIAVVGLLLLAACGGDEDTTRGPASPTPLSHTPAPRGLIAPPTYCSVTMAAAPSLNLEVSARWKGGDKIIVEGSADLPDSARLQAWICQDGQMTVALRPEGKPELKSGKIKAEWKRADVDVGPVFDPDARFEVTLAAQSEPSWLPYFIVRIPVEGEPK